MRKLFIAPLCLLLAGLCACGQTAPSEKTTAKITEELAETTIEAVPPTKFEFEPNPDDPFSFVIADRKVETGIVWPVDFSSDCYALYDTDGKGTMALLLGGANSNGEVREIYTLQDGVMERKLNANDYEKVGDSMIRILKTGYLYTERLNGSPTRGYYRFEDGQLKLVVDLGGYDDDSGSFRIDPTGTERDFFFDFVPDGTEVRIAAEEHKRLVKKFVGNWEPADLDWKPLAEYGR